MRMLPRRISPPPSIDGSMNTRVSAVISQCAIDCSRYCSFLPLKPSADGTLCRKRGDRPILRGLFTSGDAWLKSMISSAHQRVPHPQFALHPRHVVERAATAVGFAQPARVAALGHDVGHELLQRRGGAEFRGMWCDHPQHVEYIL